MSRKASLRFTFAVFSSFLLSLSAFADSHVRIVRLSYIEGGVQIDRNTGVFENAIVNLPVTEGARLRTKNDGRAEVEFEDGSTMRLAPNTNIQFTQLSLRESGAKASTADVQSGTAYVDYSGSRHDEFTLLFGGAKTTLTQAAHLRIAVAEDGASLAVFKGEVQAEGPSGLVQLKKNQTVSFDASQDAPAVVAKDIEPESLDSWDKQQSQYHQRYASNSYSNYSPYAYGTNDLSYYGAFFSAPGYGMLWQPYFIDASWNPFMNGAWAFSPGFGYGWVSSYPWGWTPYHYGTWVFLPVYGWAWQPGGAWMPWYSQPQLLRAPSGFKPPRPPANLPTRGPTIVTVNHGPLSGFAPRSRNKIEIRNNSAGLGVPRGLSNISKVSQQVQEKGMVTQRIHPAPSQPMWRGDAGPAMDSPRGSGPRPSMSAPRTSSPPPPPRMSAPPSGSAPGPRTGPPHK